MSYRKELLQRRKFVYGKIDSVEESDFDFELADEGDCEPLELTVEEKAILNSGDQVQIARKIEELDQKLYSLNNALEGNTAYINNCFKVAKEAHVKATVAASGILSSEFTARYRLGEILCGVYLSEVLNFKVGTVIYDKATFSTTPQLGRRRYDAFFIEENIAFESKIGYQPFSKRIKIQADKDQYLLRSGKINKVYWLIHTNGSKRLVAELLKRGIIVVTEWMTEDIHKMVFRGSVPDWLPKGTFHSSGQTQACHCVKPT